MLMSYAINTYHRFLLVGNVRTKTSCAAVSFILNTETAGI